MSTADPIGAITAAGPREQARREALRALQILDQPVAEGISDVVRLAAEVCGVPFATMNIIDDEWQRSLSTFGGDLGPVPRQDAMCNQVVTGGQAIITADARLEPVFRNNPFVNGDVAELRFYASVPLETEAGDIVGTLCAYDNDVHEIAPNHIHLLQALARQAMGIIQLQRAVHEASRASEQLAEQAIRVAEVLESSQDAYVALDQNGVVTGWNRAAEGLFGYTRDEAIGQNMADLAVPSSHRAFFAASLVTAAEDDETGTLPPITERQESTPSKPPRLHNMRVPALTKDRRERTIDLTVWRSAASTDLHAFARDVTAIQAAERQRDAAEERWRVAFESAPIGMVVTDLSDPEQPRLSNANRMFLDMVGMSLEQLQALDTPASLTHPDDVAADLAAIGPLVRGELMTYRRDKRYLHADGSVRWGRLSASIARTSAGYYLISQIEDITEWRDADQAQRQAENLLAIAFEHAPTGIAVIAVCGQDRGRLLRVNPALATMTGHAAGVGADLDSLLDTEADPDSALSMLSQFMLLADGELNQFQQICRLHAGGGHISAEAFVVLSRDQNGKPEHALAQLRDVTREQAHEQWLTTRATTDELTGVANRLAMRERLGSEIDALRAEVGHLVVVMLDLDRFKLVNDTLGHEAGDELLREVAEALVTVAPPAALVSRLGGDEFLVIAPRQNDEQAQLLGEHLRLAVEQVGERHNRRHNLGISASVGVTSTVNPSAAPEDLLRAADQAMYQSKRASHAHRISR